MCNSLIQNVSTPPPNGGIASGLSDSLREPAGGTSSIMVQAATRDAGVVGVGVMGSDHARVFADLPGVKLVGVA
jgi:hypothetical protein